MIIRLFPTNVELAKAAAQEAATVLRQKIGQEGKARIIAATAASQFPFLDQLRAFPGIAWGSVEVFHLDEYVGIPVTHPASFRKHLFERLIQPAGIKCHHLLDGEGELAAVCENVGRELRAGPIHLAFVGIGENSHVAFNDPPADFNIEAPYIIVTLDEACRRQQVGEGWFKTMDEVPRQAITISIRQLLKAQKILCIVPDLRKARAVKACLEGEISPQSPGSILRTHPDVTYFFDTDSASMLSAETLMQAQRQT